MKSKSTAVEITVTKKNYDVAAAAVSKGKQLTSFCLLAIAIKEAFPKKKVQVLTSTAQVGTTNYDLPKKAVKLIDRFDSLHLGYGEMSKGEKNKAAKLRASLPVTFTMTEETAQKSVAATA
jgi:hypothetical protein